MRGHGAESLPIERTRYLIAYFLNHPCADCGEADPIVLEFDHLKDKAFNIGASLSGRSWASILDEIAKCDVVCANCHRRRTARRKGSLRALITQQPRADVERATGIEPAAFSLEG